MRIHRINDVTAIRDEVSVPVLGVLPINAFVVHAEQPVLVDTGRPVVREQFLDALCSVIDPSEIRWIWLTHPDRDHMGSLMDVLQLAPQARLVTNFMGFGYLGVEFDIPPHRVHLLNPGQSINVGAGRTLRAFRPPLYDSPMTLGFFDESTGTCVASDCFGGPMPSLDAAHVDDIGEIEPADVRAAQLLWAAADSPWVCTVDPAKFTATYDELRRFAPELVLSTHLPPARGHIDTLIDMLGEAPHAQPVGLPDQAALEAMLSGLVPDQPGAAPVTA